ncbi:MAG: hypothetical protein JW816_00280 [Candidatus Buchananbacteria bacterium]|nr:hypothetical protein [Candidatus Buchananbacteria bacterium]
MRIVICGSVVFAKEMKAAKEQLEKMGHQTEVPFYVKKIISGEVDYDTYIKTKETVGDTDLRQKADEDLIKRYYRLIGQSDAILVINIERKGIKNYIGGNTLMELGFAYVLNKPIFLLNPIPEMGYSDEIIATKPIILNGDLTKIKND